ncbi:30S ribosomal protein S20 [bacterium]|nr:30S ribosomal protein S20 [bacterium]|tara:strand:+ start:497 stop:760 length:264 start_codon:yes stop_codon:yes gene_type:complete
MPNTKSAKKALRQSKKRQKLNITYKKKMRFLIKQIQSFIAQKKPNKAKALLSKTYKAIDKTAKHNIIKKQTANRKKSRLARAINKSL